LGSFLSTRRVCGNKSDTISLFLARSPSNPQQPTANNNNMISNTFGSFHHSMMISMMFMLFVLVMQSTAAAAAATMTTPLYSMSLPTEPEMTLSVWQDATTQDITVDLVMDDQNKYTSNIEIGDLLQGNIMTAGVKIRGFRTVDGVAMPEQVLLEMDNIGSMIMAMVLNPSSSDATSTMLNESMTQFMDAAMADMPSSNDTVFWQAMSTVLERWITQDDSGGARQLLLVAAEAAAAAARTEGGLRRRRSF
jgi:hypothetical protein